MQWFAQNQSFESQFLSVFNFEAQLKPISIKNVLRLTLMDDRRSNETTKLTDACVAMADRTHTREGIRLQ